MDKELSISQVWQVLGYGIVFLAVAAVVWRWLVPVGYFVAMTGLGFAWTEWFDPTVGPDIAYEAGPTYGLHVYAAILILQILAVLAWHVSSRFSIVKRFARGGLDNRNRDLINNAGFSMLLFLITALFATAGSYTNPEIWSSPPILGAAAFLVFSVWRWQMKKKREDQ